MLHLLICITREDAGQGHVFEGTDEQALSGQTNGQSISDSSKIWMIQKKPRGAYGLSIYCHSACAFWQSKVWEHYAPDAISLFSRIPCWVKRCPNYQGNAIYGFIYHISTPHLLQSRDNLDEVPFSLQTNPILWSRLEWHLIISRLSTKQIWILISLIFQFHITVIIKGLGSCCYWW